MTQAPGNDPVHRREAASDLRDDIAVQMQQYGGQALEALREFRPSVETWMRDQPGGTIATAAVIGFVLGALWRR